MYIFHRRCLRHVFYRWNRIEVPKDLSFRLVQRLAGRGFLVSPCAKAPPWCVCATHSQTCRTFTCSSMPYGSCHPGFVWVSSRGLFGSLRGGWFGSTRGGLFGSTCGVLFPGALAGVSVGPLEQVFQFHFESISIFNILHFDNV